MASVQAARRYAGALFGLAREDSRIAEVRGELGALVQLLTEHAELRSVLLTPLHPVAERKAVLLALARKLEFSMLLQNFCGFLVDRRRLLDFEGIRDEYERLSDEASGLVVAEVVAATELDAGRQEQLQRALSARTGREVKLEIRVDPDLIGGAVATVGDLVFDGSLRTQLAHLGANLKLGANLTQGS